MTNNASEFIGDIPKNYDRFLGPVIFEAYADDIARRAAQLKPARVLELAAGTGIVSRKLKDAFGPDTHLTVTDLNAPMLEIARSKFSAGDDVAFETADAMALQFPDDHFDLVVCQFGLMFFPDKIASFREAHRVLKPGGTYLFNTWGSHAENPFAPIAQDVAAKFMPDNPPGFYHVPFSYPDPAIVIPDFTSGGFQHVTSETLSINQTVTDWNAFAHGFVFGNPLFDEIKNRGGVNAHDVARAIEQALRKAFGIEPASMPLKATVFEGRAG